MCKEQFYPFVVLLLVFLILWALLGFYAARPAVFLPLMPSIAVVLASLMAAPVGLVTWIVAENRLWLCGIGKER
jgi:hypothetical protein